MNFNRIGKLDELLTNELKRKPTIILDPNPEQSYRISGTVNDLVIGIDADEWVIPDELKPFIIEVAENNISDEEKILKVYQKLCEDYTYDDNILSYIKKNDDDTFFLPDEYGRETDASWKENRQKHNRRNCFEISRILAKSITEIVKLSGNAKNYDVCIIWDEANAHYFVGLACNNYYVSLDLDDFKQIKDFTRAKTGLTLEGIKILEDTNDKFGKVIKEINSDRAKIAKEYMQEKIQMLNSDDSKDESKVKAEDDSISDNKRFLQYVIQILKEDYNLDSAGIYEYLKEIVDTKLGAKFRKKVWKEIENNPGKGKRYTRCLIVNIEDNSYLIDVTKDSPNEIFQQFDERELEKQESKIIPFKEMTRDWNKDPYDGR